MMLTIDVAADIVASGLYKSGDFAGFGAGSAEPAGRPAGERVPGGNAD